MIGRSSGQVDDESRSTIQEDGANAPETLLLLLAVPDRVGPNSTVAGVTRLMKLLFLAAEEAGFSGPDNFRFVPYKYGPFAPDLYDALRFLRERGLIEIDNSNVPDYYQVRELGDLQDASIREAADRLARLQGDILPTTQWMFRLTPLGSELADKLAEKAGSDRIRRLREIKGRYGHMPLNELLAYVYQRYPAWGQKSVHPLATPRPDRIV